MKDDIKISQKPRRKNTNDRITIETLKYFVPLFHLGEESLEKLLNGNLTPSEKNFHENQSRLKELVVNKIAALSGPLITRELNKIIMNSHLKNKDDLFDILYYAGINGMTKGLRHFDVTKINQSSTNYLFQWIVTYAKKELSVIEAPFGVAPSRFQRYKKISAVRKKMSSNLGRYAENEEVLEYFLSGKADLKNLNGPVGSSDKPSRANLSMTLDIIKEQEDFEKNLSTVNLLDPIEDYSAEIQLSREDDDPFSQTIFGVFLNKYNFTPEATAVLMSDLQATSRDFDVKEITDTLTSSEYRILSNRWKDLMKDISGPFYKFLISVQDDSFDQFDVGAIISQIEKQNKNVGIDKYLVLFEEKRVVKNV